MATSGNSEVEIKFVVSNVEGLVASLKRAGFREQTPPTYESNTLFDRPTGELRAKSEVLRIRRYGERWRITHKSKGTVGRHKSRTEHETGVADGSQMRAILEALGYQPAFCYEKFRSEWTDGQGEVVIDRTPIGDVAEIEGIAEWIDATAAKLGIVEQDYIKKSYAEMFNDWKRRTNSAAQNMTFHECGTPRPY